MGLFALANESINKTTRADLRCPPSHLKQLHAYSNQTTRISRQTRASDPSWIREIDHDIVRFDVVDKLPQKHLCHDLGRLVVLLGVELLGIIEGWQEGISIAIWYPSDQGQRCASDRDHWWFGAVRGVVFLLQYGEEEQQKEHC